MPNSASIFTESAQRLGLDNMFSVLCFIIVFIVVKTQN